MYDTVSELIAEWNQEAVATQKVMDTLTDDSLQQPVASGGRTLGRIAWHIVTSTPGMLGHFGLTVGGVTDPDTVPTSAKAISDGFRKVSGAAADAIRQQWTDAALKQIQKAFGRDMSNAAIVLLLVKHHAHHRGQMTVLMRQAGLTVQGVYGPAKEEWSRMGMDAPAF